MGNQSKFDSPSRLKDKTKWKIKQNGRQNKFDHIPSCLKEKTKWKTKQVQSRSFEFEGKKQNRTENSLRYISSNP